MKIKTTRNYLKNVYKNVYCAGYCDLQYIFRCTEAAYYNSGVYGWNWDAYADFNTDAVITTGYRNMIGSRVPDELIEKYTVRAKEIVNNQFNIENYAEAMHTLQRNFWDELSRRST